MLKVKTLQVGNGSVAFKHYCGQEMVCFLYTLHLHSHSVMLDIFYIASHIFSLHYLSCWPLFTS